MFKYLSILGSLLLFAASTHVAHAQLTVAVSGTKQVTLNDNVNKNQFIWLSEAPLENIRGTSEGVTGGFSIDPKDLTTMRGSVVTQTKTMTTGNGPRDNHLYSPEWLGVAKYPTITFKITSVSDVKASGNTATALVSGAFTMHGVTKQMNVPIKLTYLVSNDKTRQRAPGDLVMISADFSLKLKDFNIAGTEGVVGSKVGENIKITAQLFGNTN
jgi:polyisoprenoid-binding protein YceI